MNANELAKGLSQNQIYGDDYGLFNKRIQNMLRQQQAEIESMQERMIVAEKELNHMRSFFGCDPAYYGMTPAEPVAWINCDNFYSLVNGDIDHCTIYANSQSHNDDEVKLYAEPQIKELSDEVIDALQDALNGWKYIRENHGDLYGVGWDRVQDKLEAILRKAQEK